MTDYLHRNVDTNDPQVVSAFDQVSMWSARFGALILDNLELRPGITALDLACGAGYPLFELAQMHGRSSHFVGVDNWDLAMQRAAYKLAAYRDPQVSLTRADGLRLPFAANTFDLITSNVGINNFDDFDAVLAECARVLRVDGRIVLTSNVTGNMAEFYVVFRKVLEELGLADRIPALDAQEAHRLTLDLIAERLTGAGFAIRQRIAQPFVMRFVDGAAMFHHWLINVGFLDGWRQIIEREDEERVFARVEARLNQIAAQQGELRMTIPMIYIEARRI